MPKRTILCCLASTKRTDAFFLFSFQSKFSVPERCQVKIRRSECILLTCKSGNGDKSLFIKLLSPTGELISGPFLLNWSLYKEIEITSSTISRLSIVGTLKINSKYIICDSRHLCFNITTCVQCSRIYKALYNNQHLL